MSKDIASLTDSALWKLSPANIEKLRGIIIPAIAKVKNLADLERIRVTTVGKSSILTDWMKQLGAMNADERQAIAPAIHQLRTAVTEAIAIHKAKLEQAAITAQLAQETCDLSLPAAVLPSGTIHPISQTLDQLVEIFTDIGFAVAVGPEIEDDWHNFTALNIGEAHPARAMHDSFYFPDLADSVDVAGAAQLADTAHSGVAQSHRLLLRTHTSPVQIRTMRSTEPPIYIIAPGRVYRADSDATHTPMFHQIEGLVIDHDIHMGHLRWTLETFLKAFFEREDIVLRLRPSYFPFTEPSVEIDVGYMLDKRRRIVGGSGDDEGHGWMELLGGGMVHRRVIENCDLDPTKWQGFAFGVGVDRLAMLKYGIQDLRDLFDADLAWLKHYGFGACDVPTLSGGISGAGASVRGGISAKASRGSVSPTQVSNTKISKESRS